MRMALALGIVENVIGFETIDDQITVKVGAKDVSGNLMAASALAGANGIDGDVLVAENPQPGIEGADAPAGLVGMDDIATAQGIDEEIESGPGQMCQALF